MEQTGSRLGVEDWHPPQDLKNLKTHLLILFGPMQGGVEDCVPDADHILSLQHCMA